MSEDAAKLRHQSERADRIEESRVELVLAEVRHVDIEQLDGLLERRTRLNVIMTSKEPDHWKGIDGTIREVSFELLRGAAKDLLRDNRTIVAGLIVTADDGGTVVEPQIRETIANLLRR